MFNVQRVFGSLGYEAENLFAFADYIHPGRHGLSLVRKIPFQERRNTKSKRRPSLWLDMRESLYIEDAEGWTCPGGGGRVDGY